VAYCYRWSSVVCLSVCLSVIVVSSVKTVELIEIPFACGLGWALGTTY